ncbi:MAG: hypothetical protein Q9172_001842 [Xanthocarpia lactea]
MADSPFGKLSTEIYLMDYDFLVPAGKQSTSGAKNIDSSTVFALKALMIRKLSIQPAHTKDLTDSNSFNQVELATEILLATMPAAPPKEIGQKTVVHLQTAYSESKFRASSVCLGFLPDIIIVVAMLSDQASNP